ncbi:MAG: TIR domain-containing protein [Thiomicrospira sp.]
MSNKKSTKLLTSPKKNGFTPFVDNGSGGALLFMAAGAAAGNFIAPGIGGAIVGGLLGAALGVSEKGKGKVAKIPVFYSFHFHNDVMRVQQVRNIGTIEGNSPTTPNDWEQLKRSGDTAVKRWIDTNMKYKRCVVVLIGTETYSREWVRYEIKKAWEDGKALLGVYIHNLKCPRNGVSRKGKNPFDEFTFDDGRKLSSVVPTYDPSSADAYNDIRLNIANWIQHAIQNKSN